MKKPSISAAGKGSLRCLSALLAGAALVTVATPASAQAAPEEPALLEEVVVSGIRASLQNALAEKRASNNLVEVIEAEDIGKLPDQNLAEVMENIPGVQITREAGVGTGVQIRGTNANRTEINGVSTVGSGSGRSGINFEDVAASIIAAVEVTKAPDAKTIEGSVGGTINLRTIRPLDLKEQLGSVRLQAEDSSLSTKSAKPRLSGTWGNNWYSDAGQFGVVLSASYAKQDVTSFRPRVDRDNFQARIGTTGAGASSQTFDFLPIQFFIQDYDNYETETKNFAGAFEYARNDNLKFYFNAVVNNQQREQASSRVQASGVSNLKGVAVPSTFETINFGSVDGRNGVQNLGSIQAASSGVIPVIANGSSPNLRTSSDTNSRLTDSKILSLGTDWRRGRLSGRVELSTSTSDTTTPSLNTTLNFINPNVALNSLNQNGTPFVYDLTGGSLTWGIAQSAAGGPTTAQLLNPFNYQLQQVSIVDDKAENSEDAFRTDFKFDLDWAGFKSVDFGYRYNKTKSLRDQIQTNVSLSTFAESPRGNLFAGILTPGPNNFNAADGRALYVPDFLLVDPNQVHANQAAVLAALNAAIVANNALTGATRAPISSPTSLSAGYFNIAEKTSALYGQVNFAAGMFRGNAGLRYLKTDVDSAGNAILNGVATPTASKSSYNFLLPRLNLVADVHQDVVVRAGWGKDIRRPNFDDLSSAYTFSTSPNPPVVLGNPALKPEEVQSFDISAEWYFAKSSVLSLGYFHKTRTGLFVAQTETPYEAPITGYRDITAPCEQGGIFNPIALQNVFSPTPSAPGVCVPKSQTINGAGETTQQGIELAVQYDLARFEDRLRWASGFGVLANYTRQKFSGTDSFYDATSRAAQVFAANGATNVTLRAQLLDLSENAYNLTLYYEKFGVSARARYTWRQAYRSEDFGSTSSYPWGFPVVQEDRGQLNASVNYSVNEHVNLGIEGVNLTKAPVRQSCVNEGALLCFEGLTDRRITFGVSVKL